VDFVEAVAVLVSGILILSMVDGLMAIAPLNETIVDRDWRLEIESTNRQSPNHLQEYLAE
jgi:hypothetical protein